MARKSEVAAGAGFVLASIVVALSLLEIGCRLARGPEYLWSWPNFVAREWAVNDTAVNGRFIDDPLLGHVPKPGFRSSQVNYDAAGTRAMPSLTAANDGPPILVTGDSF